MGPRPLHAPSGGCRCVLAAGLGEGMEASPLTLTSRVVAALRPRKLTAEERFWSHVERRSEDECWPWRGTISVKGYGRAWLGKNHKPRATGAHRMAYELTVGPIPDGLTIDHLCRVRHCVNPKHLEPVSGRENTMRGESFSARLARQAKCIHGHEFNPLIQLSQGRRQCSQCAHNRRQLPSYKVKKHLAYLRRKAQR